MNRFCENIRAKFYNDGGLSLTYESGVVVHIEYCAITSDTLPKLRLCRFTHFVDAVDMLQK